MWIRSGRDSSRVSRYLTFPRHAILTNDKGLSCPVVPGLTVTEDQRDANARLIEMRALRRA